MSTPVSVPVARSPEQRDPAVEEAIAGEAPQRALLGYVPEQNVRNLFYAAAVTSPPSVDELVALSRTYRLVHPQPSPVVASLSESRPLPAELEDKAAEIRGTEQFRTHYELFGAKFYLVPLDELVTPQWWIDSDYVETLAARAPEPGDLPGLFDYAFPIGHLEMPMTMGPFAFQFASAKPDFVGTSPLRVTHYSPDKITM
jgi:hypothetical protein